MFRVVRLVDVKIFVKKVLGVNGAGKTSTFQMLTGENVIDKGNAYIQGFDVTRQWREVFIIQGD